MLVPHLDEYATKYRHIKFDRQDGILQVTLHTEHTDLVWGFLPHQELGYCPNHEPNQYHPKPVHGILRI